MFVAFSFSIGSLSACDSYAQSKLQRYRRNLRGETGSDIFRAVQRTICALV
jgi:hypothetical protein